MWWRFQASTGVLLHSLGWNGGFKNPWRQGLRSLPGGTSVVLSSVCPAHSWCSKNTFCMNNWITLCDFCEHGREHYFSPLLCLCIMQKPQHLTGPQPRWGSCRFHEYRLWPRGLCFPGSLRDQAAIVIRLTKWVMKFTKPPTPVVTMEGEWFLLEKRGGQRRAGEGRGGVRLLFLVLSSHSALFTLSNLMPHWF